jgi:hypothetical protein
MEKEINGTESEHSVTGGKDVQATDEQKLDAGETGNLSKEEAENDNPVEEVIDASNPEEQAEKLPDPGKATSRRIDDNAGPEEVINTGTTASESDTTAELLTEAGDKSDSKGTGKTSAGSVDEQEEAGPSEVPAEEKSATATKLVAEVSELTKNITTEALVPTEQEVSTDSEDISGEDQTGQSAEDNKDTNHKEQAATDEEQEIAVGEGVKDSTEEEVGKANKIVEEHPIERQNVDDHHDAYEDEDFSKYSKEQLVEVIKQLGKDENPIHADKILVKITPFVNQIKEEIRTAAEQKFIADGGDPAHFSYQPDEFVLRFDANYRLIKDKKAQFLKAKEREKQSNLALAEKVLDKLREFVDSEESSSSFDTFKIIQNEWKAIGDVPAQQSRSLWANYNALIHRFYDQRSIYFELKELDRKKNYDAKVKLCERAEALEDEPIIRNAIKELNDLHYEYKHMGPVPRDLQEELWQRFKKASDKIYEKRKGYVAELKTELNENLGKKEELAAEVAPLAEFNSDQIKEWNEKSRQILELQKRWDSIGGLPKEKAKAVNKKFWSAFKSFFHRKKLFFKQLESAREANLELKKDLVAQAISLQDSTEWDKTANELKMLQKQWREIGPVPGKVRNQIYEEFKKACDQFFDNRRAGSKNAEKAYDENLKNKREIISSIKKIAKNADEELDNLKSLVKQYMDIGFVPKKDISKVKNEFSEAIDEFLKASTTLSDDQKEALSVEWKMGEVLKGENSDKVLYQKEQGIRRQINKIENEVALWTNNLEFFRHSKSADKLRDEFNGKIDKANKQLEQLKRKLKVYRTL